MYKAGPEDCKISQNCSILWRTKHELIPSGIVCAGEKNPQVWNRIMFNCMVMNKYAMGSTEFEACTVDYARENELNLKPHAFLKPTFGFLNQSQRSNLRVVENDSKPRRR